MQLTQREDHRWMPRGAGAIEVHGGPFGGVEWDEEGGTLPIHTAQIGLWMFLATISMLFAGFTSAYLVRQTTGTDWAPIPLPPLLWLSTTLLLLSSVTIEIGKARWRQSQPDSLKGWLLVTTLLGVAFAVGQVFAWRQLAALGIYLPSNPHSSFFYILTGMHVVHLIGGLGALIYVLIKIRPSHPSDAQENRLKLCATYWHFLGGLWLYLFLVLFVF